MGRKWIAAMVTGITMVAGAAQAKHDNPVRQCIQDARTEKNACEQVCKDDFSAAVDTCRALNHDCADQARDDRKACVSDVLEALHQCVEDSCGDLSDLIEKCRQDFPAGSSERDQCIDLVQLMRFQCRDTCRENVELFKNLKACRDEFKADLKACRPTPPPKPPKPHPPEFPHPPMGP